MKKPVQTLVTLVTSLSLAFLGSGIASASEDTNDLVLSKTEIAKAISQAEDSAKSVIIDSSTSPAESIGEIPLGAGQVTVPTNLNEGITFTSPDQEEIVITLLENKERDNTIVMDDGGVTYVSDDGFAETVIVGDGAVQMLTTIADANAPTEYRYDIAVQNGQKLEMVDGTPAVVDENGSLELVVQAPWAVDAHGNAVPTRYEIEGNVLTQVVDHQTLSADAYPVVADPIVVPAWLLRCLVGMGINSASILQSTHMGSFWGVFGKAAWYCFRGR
ncbi:hypothetical protein [Arcanobacterium canis]